MYSDGHSERNDESSRGRYKQMPSFTARGIRNNGRVLLANNILSTATISIKISVIMLGETLI